MQPAAENRRRTGKSAAGYRCSQCTGSTAILLLWNANYDCLFFCINGDIYNSLTPEQQEVIDECGKLATDYEREINRAGDDEIMSRWQKENGVTITQNEDMDIDSFKRQ